MWSKSNKCWGSKDPGRLLLRSNGCSVEAAGGRGQLLSCSKTLNFTLFPSLFLLVFPSATSWQRTDTSLMLCHWLLLADENVLKLFLWVSGIRSILFKSILAYVLHIILPGGEKRQIPTNNICFQSQVCVKIASSQLWQGYAVPQESILPGWTMGIYH